MTAARKTRILLSLTGMNTPRWQDLLSSAGREVVTEPARPDDPAIDYAVVWRQPHGLLAPLPNLRLILSAGAGVDHLLSDHSLPDVPIVRVVAPDLTRHMVEYVVWRVLDHHRQGIAYREAQAKKLWHERAQPAAELVSVGFMGLGELGRAAAQALMPLGFRLNGWTRRPRAVDGVTCFHGREGLRDFLAGTDILVVLLPLTPETRGIVDHDLLRGLRRVNALGGAVLINAGRGGLHKEADILRALDDGTLKEASLDVFEEEPLPETSPLWTHPRVAVTPHAAASSDPEHIVPLMLEQMDAFERGERLENLVDRNAGY